MKKSIIFSLLATALLFTACEDDKTPVINFPAEGSFVLNTPPLADQTIDLNANDYLVFTCSQPDYGMTCTPSYTLQVALKPDAQGDELVTITPTQPTQAKMVVPQKKISEAICRLLGLKDVEDFTEQDGMPRKVYFRAVAQLGKVEQTNIASNWVTMNSICAYPAIPKPNVIYFVGKAEGWVGPDAAHAAHYADWTLSEKPDEIDSHIYYGVFDIPAAPDAVFRFYAKLTGWDGEDSWGCQEPDNPKDFELDGNGFLQEDLVKGKGSFNFPKWEGGLMTICVDLSDENKANVTFMAGDQM